MASISKNKKTGHRRILFVGKDNKRRTIRLGKVPLRFAQEVKTKVEAMILAGEALDAETSAWLARISEILHGRLAAVGLIPVRQKTNGELAALGPFIDAHIAKRRQAGTKANTLMNLEAGRRFLVGCFGADRDLRTITPNDADEFKLWMQGKGYAQATIGRQIKHAKYYFRVAVRSKVIEDNPFTDVKPPSQANEERKFFVTQEAAYKVLDVCPDAEWRLLFALSRFGGLRCPTEHLALTWSNVDWQRTRFWVGSPKTEHHEGKEGRWVPIFPELRPYLEEAFELAPEGSVYVISRYRDVEKNFRTRLNRIIRRAGLKPWPKPFHNLRASRETELAAKFPIHVVCAWIGNSALIAKKHYLQVTEADFDRASSAAHFTAQHETAQDGTELQPESDNSEKTAIFNPTRLDARPYNIESYARRDSNPQPTVPKTVALSS